MKAEKLIHYIPWAFSIVGCAIVMLSDFAIINVPSDNSFHFNLITVNALFGGFLYTNYSLLIGLFDNAIIEKVKNTDIIPKRNEYINMGIKCATISVGAGLVFVFNICENVKVIRYLALNIEITFLLFLIVYFLISLKKMEELIVHINENDDKISDEKIKQIKSKLFG